MMISGFGLKHDKIVIRTKDVYFVAKQIKKVAQIKHAVYGQLNWNLRSIVNKVNVA